jgi:ABC-type sugar transport system ATPase subunit
VVLGIRPENLEDASLVHDADPEAVIELPVELREELGSEVDLHCAVGVAPLHPAGLGPDEADEAAGGAHAAGPDGAAGLDGAAAPDGADHAGQAPIAGPAGLAAPVPSVLAATIVARMDPRTTLQVGEQARVKVDLAALHFFDPATGASLRG